MTRIPAILLLASLMLAACAPGPRDSARTHWVVVPDVVGLEVAEATKELAAAGLDGFTVNKAMPGPGCAVRHVCATRPAAGQRVLSTDTVALHVGVDPNLDPGISGTGLDPTDGSR